jgi:hypothetical protein
VAGVEPTPIFAALARTDAGDGADARRRRGAHDDGRPVTDLLRALREDRDGRGDEAPGTPTRRAGTGRWRVGHVPDVLSF